MEDLTKTQLILLCILISFVSAIATSIITTSLLAEAPLQTTQTINKIVQNTVERVVPEDIESKPKTQVIVQPGEGELMVSVFEETKDKRIAISTKDGTLVGYAFAIDETHLVYKNSLDRDAIGVFFGDAFSPLEKTSEVFGLVIASIKDGNTFKYVGPKDDNARTGETIVLINPENLLLESTHVSGIETIDSGTREIIMSSKPSVSGLGSIAVDLEANIVGFIGDDAGSLKIIGSSSL
ncbi:hypothetical protein KC842_02725 [Candidatus Nomurabacteria bacterium]|nr:hypothetical protein [Candidatus Nomurabacteria bacterium]USN95062.1 MAG: hypothetical protein H6791_01380 [Candidatus Nomurabacteria bacterium]